MRKFIINTDHVSSEIFGEEAVVVNFMTGKYFGMTGSAPVIWQLFETPITRDDVIDKLTGLKGQTNEFIENVQSFINILLQENLIIESGISNFEKLQSKTVTINPNDLQIPCLEIYDDLQELIVLDPVHDADPERGWPVQLNIPKPE
jgi:hypothetical protein